MPPMTEAEFIEQHLADTRGTAARAAAHEFLCVEQRHDHRFIPNLPRDGGPRRRVPGDFLQARFGDSSFRTAEEAARARGAYLYREQQQGAGQQQQPPTGAAQQPAQQSGRAAPIVT